ncbi:MAG: nitric-oxide reductase large subunit [Myxococcota bacterium]
MESLDGARRIRRLAIALAVVMIASFSTLLYFGRGIYQAAPPIPEAVVAEDGSVLFTRADIETGQDVWRSIGGHELGSIWGHGAYVAPDWTADWLHREATWLLDRWARDLHGLPYAGLAPDLQAALRARLQEELRTNRHDPEHGVLTVSSDRAAAIAAVGAHYRGLFRDDPALDGLRTAYAMPRNTVGDAERAEALEAFFFWATWACVTQRPGEEVTYTQNWPPDELVGNRPTGAIVVVSVASFVLLLGGIGALSWVGAASRTREEAEAIAPPARDPLFGVVPTPSMRATGKYFWIVGALLVAQMGLGIVVAHYGVEGNGLYGLPLADWLPYSLARTWHGQLGIFWIATSWLATGLVLAPLVAGFEPKGQRLGVNVLFVALLVVVAGSMAGQALAIHQRLGHGVNFWLGHQGYEYVDLGRLWQILLFVGLLLWLGLMARALVPAIRRSPRGSRSLLLLFTLSAGAISLCYAAGLMAGRHTNLAVAEYWRWWVVHLWVEGFFEIFATVVIAFLFSRLGLVRERTATAAVLTSALLYMTGGVLGMFHHLYFTGTPSSILALGGTFSALELMPLVLIGHEGYRQYRLANAAPWLRAHRWPLRFFLAVAFWNLVGAGLFGFLINPPIALYYMQGLNTTPVHSHTALFGVYGMLGIGLTLFSLRLLHGDVEWRDRPLAIGFWATNVGLALMVVLSLLPIGLAQTWASVEHGMWYARSAEFLQTPGLQTLRWLRMLGDTVFGFGILAIGWFVVGLGLGWSRGGPRLRD